MSNISIEGSGGGGSSNLTVGTTIVNNGTSGFALTDNNGILGDAPIRTVLTGNLSLYVNASAGSDSYNGLSATYTGGVNGPKATSQAIVNLIAEKYDIAGYTIIINGDGGPCQGFGALPTVGGGNIFFKGSGTATFSLTTGPNDGNYNTGECAAWHQPTSGTTWYMGNLTLDGTNVPSNNAAIFISEYNTVIWADPTNIGTPVDMAVIGNPGISLIQTDVFGYFQDGLSGAEASVTLSGNALNALSCIAQSQMLVVGSYTLVGTPAYSQAFLQSGNLSFPIIFPNSVTGAATGQEFALTGGAAGIGAGLPGDAPGTCDPVSSWNGSPVPLTVASLNSNFAAASYPGARMFVTDSNATLAAGLGNIVAGTGGNAVPVYSDATNWRIG
jgi:hypothetical protein